MDINLLISEVYKRPAIWDKRLQSHLNRVIVDKHWKEISSEMKENEEKIRRKWKYLRGYFISEFNKFSQSKSGDATETDPQIKWPYFKQMLFIRDSISPRQFIGNSENGASGEEDEITATIEPEDTLIESPSGSDAIETTSAVRTRKRKTEETFNETVISIEREKLELLKSKRARATNLEDDEDYQFFRSLLPHVRKIPDEMKFSFRSRIQSTVDEYAYRRSETLFPNSPLQPLCSHAPQCAFHVSAPVSLANCSNRHPEIIPISNDQLQVNQNLSVSISDSSNSNEHIQFKSET